MVTARRALAAALGLFVVWTVATYVLEGRIETLLRPEATLDRTSYVLIANLLIGTFAATLLLRRHHSAGIIDLGRVGFRSVGRSLITVVCGAALGLVLFALQNPPTLEPIVILNGFAQVLSVSVAEVLVCWVVVGGTVEAVLRPRGSVVVVGAAILASSALFGVYHFAHSPPFNTPGMVLFLTVVSLVTGLFFFVSRDVYGTIAFHNLLGVLGVLQALDRAGRLESYAAPQIPLIATGAVAIGLLTLLHMIWLRPAKGTPV